MYSLARFDCSNNVQYIYIALSDVYVRIYICIYTYVLHEQNTYVGILLLMLLYCLMHPRSRSLSIC